MRWFIMVPLFIATVLLSARAAEAQHEASPARVFKSCSGCHGVPDSRLAGDDLWIGRIATTACVQPMGPKSRPKRNALQAYLRGEGVERTRLEREPRALEKDDGTVTLGFGDASVLLVPISDHAGAPVRLVWSSKEKEGGARAVPAGRYRIQNYRIGFRDDKGVRWELWGSGHEGRKLTVLSGQETSLDLDRRVHVKSMARPAKGKLQLSVQVLGDSGMGATIVRAGDRVPAAYEVRSEERGLAHGKLQYG